MDAELGRGGGGQRCHGAPGLPTRAASASTLGPARGWSRTNWARGISRRSAFWRTTIMTAPSRSSHSAPPSPSTPGSSESGPGPPDRRCYIFFVYCIKPIHSTNILWLFIMYLILWVVTEKGIRTNCRDGTGGQWPDVADLCSIRERFKYLATVSWGQSSSSSTGLYRGRCVVCKEWSISFIFICVQNYTWNYLFRI